MNESNVALYAAVEEGSLEKINEAVASGADVNFLSERELPGWKEKYAQKGTGNSVLHLACWLSLDRAIIDRLLELGSNVHLKSLDGGYLPIHTATTRGNIELIGLLLDKGCNPYTKDKLGRAPLYWSSYFGQKEVVELLINRNADIDNNENRYAMTSLMTASMQGHNEVVELLLDRGADICIKSNLGNTSLMIASREGHNEVVRLLLDRGSNVNDRTISGWTSLIWASWKGHLEVVKLLLVRGADIGARINNGENSLMFASQAGHLAIVSVLEKWPVTMYIVVLQELVVYHLIGIDSLYDLIEYVG